MVGRAEVYNNGVLAGFLEKHEDFFLFRYDIDYYNDPTRSAISLSLPKTQHSFQSDTLFPFFYGLLSEGVNRQTQCRLLRIDENDHFSLLLRTADSDTIGAITIRETVL